MPFLLEDVLTAVQYQDMWNKKYQFILNEEEVWI